MLLITNNSIWFTLSQDTERYSKSNGILNLVEYIWLTLIASWIIHLFIIFLSYANQFTLLLRARFFPHMFYIYT